MTEEMTGKPSLFVSYSHKDQEWFEKFREILDAAPNLDTWTDSSIETTDDWDQSIQTALGDASIALLLISPAFLSSEYIRSKELPMVLEALKENDLKVMWVRVKSTPDSILPKELLALQTFKIKNSAKTSLSELDPGEATSEISTICEHIIGRTQFKGGSRYNLYKSVKDTVWRFGYSGLEEIAHGDYSVVYKAERPGSTVVVKALVNSPLDHWDQYDDECQAMMKKAASLRDRTFVRLHRALLEQEPRFLVTEWIENVTLHHHMNDSAKPVPVDEVRFFVQVLARALDEYHRHEMVYGNIKPSDILLEQTPDGLMPRLPAYRFGQMAMQNEQQQNSFLVNPERLTYITPEQYRGGPSTPRTDQYSLGLLAVEMLQGSPPVAVEQLSDLEQKTAFFKNAEEFTQDLQTRAPKLVQVLLRMLRDNPDERWESMATVVRELGDARDMEGSNRRLAKKSYNDVVCAQKSEFYEKFYKNLRRGHDHLAALFEQKLNNWETQYLRLDTAVCNLLNYSDRRATTQPTLLTGVAESHRHFGLKKSDFTHFMKSFLKTLAQFGEKDEETQIAWKKTLKLGIDYLKKNAIKSTKAN